MQRTAIDPSILQPMLESAPNALSKGQAQYFTPPELAADLAGALPPIRPTITDLNCGAGHLLFGSINATTAHLLGADIDPCRFHTSSTNITSRKIPADLTLLYPLLCEVEWQADLIVLNPPWDLHWHKERLESLANLDDEPCISDAFNRLDPRVGPRLIDATIASLMIAIDRLTYRGEGFCIANHNTMERLIFAHNAPYQELANYIWARRLISGNPMTASSTRRKMLLTPEAIRGDREASVEVLYFARNLDHPNNHIQSGRVNRADRNGPSITSAHQVESRGPVLWQAVNTEWAERYSDRPPKYNLSLDDGAIRVHLSTFKQASGKTDRELVKRLFDLQGQRPMQLVLQRATRCDLLRNLELWTVDPALRAAVEKALADYNAIRAPLYPLPEIQRLGYLEEEDQIRCKKTLDIAACEWWRHDRVLSFQVDLRYALRTETVAIMRSIMRPNLQGRDEEILLTGKELAFYVALGHESDEVCFLLDPARAPENIHCPILPLSTLAEHFHIPEVPDVSITHAEGYQSNLTKLAELETLFV